MYTISNATLAELKPLLEALAQLPGTDNKTANLKRKAKVTIGKLHKAKKQQLNEK